MSVYSLHIVKMLSFQTVWVFYLIEMLVNFVEDEIEMKHLKDFLGAPKSMLMK